MTDKKKSFLEKNKNIIIIVGVLLVGYFFFYSSTENAISHNFVSFKQNGAEVSTAKINVPVTLTLDFYPNSLLGFTGVVNINIYKDVPLTDSKFTLKQIQLNIPMGLDKKQTVSMDFTPDEVTGLTLREYYYTITDSKGKILYDPGRDIRASLKVSTTASGGTVPKFTSLTFNNQPQITVSPGTAITTKVTMSGQGTGTLKVEIRKDIGYSIPDSVYTILNKEINIDGSTVIQMDNWNAQSGGLGFREYFAKIYWNNDLIYDPTNPDQREYVKLSDGGTTPPLTGSISLKSVAWNAVANQYSTATLTFHLTGAVQQSVTIDVRQDVSGGDINLQSQSCALSGTDKDVTCTVSFTSPNAGEYIFIRVSGGIYDVGSSIFDFLTARNTRISQGTEIIVSSTGGGTTPTPTTTQPPATANVYYNIIELKSGSNGGTRINVPQYSTVDVYTTVTSNMATSGQISIEVRKDLSGFPWKNDETLTVLSKSVSLQSGTNTILVGSFSASDLTGSNSFVQYFFKPSWNGKLLNDPTDRNSRESVTTYSSGGGTTPTPTTTVTQPPTQGTATLSNIGFTTGSNPSTGAIIVNKWQNVNVYAYIYTTGAASGTVLIQINKDKVLDTDSTFKSLTGSFNLNSAGSNWVYVGTFSPDQSTSTSPLPGTLREYFGRGSAKSYGFEYDPQDENTRSRVYVN